MATEAQGTRAVRSFSPPSYQDWEFQKRNADLNVARAELAAGQAFVFEGGVAGQRAGQLTVGGAVQPKGSVFPDPVLRYGYPGKAKGAIYALDPDDHSLGDALYFSRYPTELNEKLEAVLASDTTPGRAYPAFQQMGAKGVQLSVELWFCDAYMWSTRSNFITVQSVQNPVDFEIEVVRETPVGTLAEQAKTFFEFYIAGHDGTGIALPPADLFLHWGGRELPIPVVIRSVDLKMEHFTSDSYEGRRAQPSGAPQMVTARVDFEVNIPLRTFDPFKPKRPKPGKPSPPKKPTCINHGTLPDGTSVLGVSATHATFGNFTAPEKARQEQLASMLRILSGQRR